MYKELTNNPAEREKIIYPWTYWDGAFELSEIDRIVQYCMKLPEKSAEILGETSPEKIEKWRVSNVRFFHPDAENTWAFQKINGIIQALNEKYYNFDLNGYDAIQFTEYDGTREGKYDWHMDTEIGNVNRLGVVRKLSFVMNLTEPNSDYEGGEFQINTGTENAAETVHLPKGRCIVFPSFLLHRVKPVTKGTRRSLVAWVVGPKFK